MHSRPCPRRSERFEVPPPSQNILCITKALTLESRNYTVTVIAAVHIKLLLAAYNPVPPPNFTLSPKFVPCMGICLHAIISTSQLAVATIHRQVDTLTAWTAFKLHTCGGGGP